MRWLDQWRRHNLKAWRALVCLTLTLALGGCVGGLGARSGGMSSKDNRLSAHLKMGAAYLEVGNWNSALAELSKADLLEPNNIEVNTYLGQTYYFRGDYPQAIERFKKVLSLDPTKTEMHNNLGLIYLKQRHFAEARQEFELCIKDPTYSNTHQAEFNLGLLEESEGRLDLAEEIYRKVINSNKMPEAYFRMGQLAFNRQDYQIALDYLLPALRLKPNYADAFFTVAMSYERLGRVDEAAEAYGQVVNLIPNTSLAIEAQGRARRLLGFK